MVPQCHPVQPPECSNRFSFSNEYRHYLYSIAGSSSRLCTVFRSRLPASSGQWTYWKDRHRNFSWQRKDTRRDITLYWGCCPSCFKTRIARSGLHLTGPRRGEDRAFSERFDSKVLTFWGQWRMQGFKWGAALRGAWGVWNTPKMKGSGGLPRKIIVFVWNNVYKGLPLPPSTL